jgi:uncharacterized lipoprotein YehR (DUF1307 family)
MKKRVSMLLAMAVIFMLSNCADKTMAKHPLSNKQTKKMYSAKSSGPSAPVLIKDILESQSAKANTFGRQ